MSYSEFKQEQIACFMKNDPSLRSKREVYFMPGYKAIRVWYFAHQLYLKKHYVLARYLSLRCQQKTGIDIHPGATIGHRLFIDHGVGVVIGETCIIGDDVMIYQGVTLGGTGKEKGKRHPTVEDRVLVGAGAKVIGNIILGHDCKVGSGAIVIRNVDPFVTVVSPPAYPVRDKREKMSNLCVKGKERWTRQEIHDLQHGKVKEQVRSKVSLTVTDRRNGSQKESIRMTSNTCSECAQIPGSSQDNSVATTSKSSDYSGKNDPCGQTSNPSFPQPAEDIRIEETETITKE